jgi:nucleoside permease NupC
MGDLARDELRPQIARYGVRVVAAGSPSNPASATIAGFLLGSGA